jgi:regulator of protease activity HflC (stomatin/prohibitin superfamily)
MFGFILALIVIFVVVTMIYRIAVRTRVREGRGGEILSIPRVSLGAAIPIALVGLLVLLLVPPSVRVVPVGHCLVVFNVLTKQFRVARQGFNIILPYVNQVTDYDLRRLEYTMSVARGEGRRADIDDSLWSPTQEGLQVGIDLTCWHHIDPLHVAQIHQKIGPDYEEKVIRPTIRSVVRLVVSEYPVMDVYSAKRQQIQDEISQKITEMLGRDGFLVTAVVLRDVIFSEQFAKAIEEKQIAQQSAEKMRYVLEKEQKEAERKVIEATGRAKAITVINTALRENPNYIKYLYVDKLSDKISVIVSDQSTIMDLKGLLKGAE